MPGQCVSLANLFCQAVELSSIFDGIPVSYLICLVTRLMMVTELTDWPGLSAVRLMGLCKSQLYGIMAYTPSFWCQLVEIN